MYDLSNLNDYEFECLGCDIMTRILNMQLYVFPRGVDKGVDICDKSVNPSVVIQVKHYYRSTYPQLKASLKHENEKINRIAPKKYYILTSASLTKQNKNEIVGIFDKYIPDTSYIYARNDIDDFLKKEENKDIVFKIINCGYPHQIFFL